MLNNKHFEYIGRISCLWSGIEQSAQIYLAATYGTEFELAIQKVLKLDAKTLIVEIEKLVADSLPHRASEAAKWKEEFLELKDKRHGLVHAGWEKAYEDLALIVPQRKIKALRNEYAKSQFFIRKPTSGSSPILHAVWTYAELEIVEARMKKLARDFFTVFM